MNLPNEATAVFAFGRMNPPTKGHGHLISQMLQVAREQRATPLLYLSKTIDSKKNPLTFEEKKEIVNQEYEILIQSSSNPFTALEELSKDYKRVIFFAGQDRIADYNRNMPEFAKELGIVLEIVSSGNRIDSATGIESVSASKARNYVKENNFVEFEKIVLGIDKQYTFNKISESCK